MKQFFTGIIFFAFALLYINTAQAQAPKSVNYQAVARDNSGVIMANQSVNVGISILQGSASGTSVCDETFSVTTNSFGLINLQLGTQNPSAFSVIDWGADNYYIEVSLDGIVFGTSQLVSVPYALHAAVADSVAGVSPIWETDNYHNIYLADSTNQVGIGTTDPSTPLHLKTTGTSISDGFRMETSQATGEDWYLYMNPNDYFVIRNDANDLITIQKDTGNVGIGVAYPKAQLDIENDKNSNTIWAKNTRNSSSNCGVYSLVEANNDYQYAVYGEARINSTSDYWAYGGYFIADANDHATGTNADAYGVSSIAYGDDNAYGVKTKAYGDDIAYGIYASGYGDNYSYGVYGYGGSANSGVYAVYGSGHLTCSGTKAATVRTDDGPKELYSQESPEIWFEDFGSASVTNGQVVVNLQSDFVSTVTVNDQHPIKVFITPNSNLGNWWVEKNGTSFILHAPDAADGAEFDFRVVAKRAGYEDYRMKDAPAAYSDYFLYDSIDDVPEEHRQEWILNAPEEVQEQYPQYKTHNPKDSEK